jgi:hypothetical protein
MELIQTLIDLVTTLLFSLVGWALWTAIDFSILKNDRQDNYTWAEFKKTNNDEMIGTLLTTAFLLMVGWKGVGINLVSFLGEGSASWSDLYYALSGFVFKILVKIKRAINQL